MAYGSNQMKPKKTVSFEKKIKKNIVLSENAMKKLKDHAKLHKGGMASKQGGMKSSHMKTMIKKMKEGFTFNQAHKLALAN